MTHWTYDQATGKLTDPAGGIVARGYSGHGNGKNSPAREADANVGPIPRGEWRIDLVPYNSGRVGPHALKLEPVGHDAHGRSAFRIHGDSVARPGTASHGCIILPKTVRRAIVASGVSELIVT